MKIGIMNGGGYKNWGDDAQLYNVVLKLKKYKYTDLLVFSRAKYLHTMLDVPTCNSSHLIFKDCKNDKDLLKRFDHIVNGFENTQNLSLIEKNFIKNMKSLDVYFFAGSGVINTRHLRGLCIFLAPLIIAKKLGKKVVVSAQGIGPFNKTQYYDIIKSTLNSLDCITVRDFDSGVNQLKEIGVTIPIHKVADDAFDFPIITNRFSSLKDKKVIGINISQYLHPLLIDQLHYLAVYFQDIGYVPIFNHFQNEIALAKECSKGKFEIVEFNTPSEIAEFYSHCDVAIGMRYHSTIFCLSQKVPHINLYCNAYQKLKINAIENEFNIKFGVDCSESIPNLIPIVEKTLLNDKWNEVYDKLKITQYKTMELINE
jgi:polysaccharide pyruvyl transferase WcaK-like protein